MLQTVITDLDCIDIKTVILIESFNGSTWHNMFMGKVLSSLNISVDKKSLPDTYFSITNNSLCIVYKEYGYSKTVYVLKRKEEYDLVVQIFNNLVKECVDG